MPEINISNKAGRNAAVNMESVRVPLRVRWLDDQGRPATSVRVLKSTFDHDVDALAAEFDGIENVGQALIDGDPEVNMEVVGSFLTSTSRVYVDKDQKLVHRVQQFDVIHEPDGSVRERRPREASQQNVSNDFPLRWTGKFIEKDEAIRKFVFSNKIQLMHINGLTYDFLYDMAKKLHEKDCLMLLGGGPKANEPLVLRRGSVPYRGFLEGRIEGDKYCLILHLSNIELKSARDETENDNQEEAK